MISYNEIFLYEKKCCSLGHPLVVGADEAGRGPIAGPLVVAAVVFPRGVFIDGVGDSKKISEKKRLELEIEIKNQSLDWAIEVVSLQKIEELNIYGASKWGMISCFHKIANKTGATALLTDAMPISPQELPNVYVESIIKGDQKSFSIGAASILAKNTRDRLMIEMHQEYPQYSWDKNKGYPTKKHREAIAEYGISPWHRKGWKLL
ncbi:MAG: ribonuclease HII [Brevinema sp.]